MIQVLQGDCLEMLKTLPAESVQCCVTSPPYWGLRNYGVEGQLGLEKTPEEYVAKMVEVFREVRRVLHDSGTVWLNLGDSYASSPAGNFGPDMPKPADGGAYGANKPKMDYKLGGLKPKDLCLIPWRLVLALQADGWWVRSIICWAKKSCMPESVTDRPTSSWEPIFLLAKSAKYFYDAEAVKEQTSREYSEGEDFGGVAKKDQLKTVIANQSHAPSLVNAQVPTSRNQRNVWHLGPENYSEAHFATFPTEIPRRAILAGTSAKGCCPKCGEPWRRQLRNDNPSKPLRDGEWEAEAIEAQGITSHGGRGGRRTYGLNHKTSEEKTSCQVTIGWEQGCECQQSGLSGYMDFPPIPCTVLDPFGGSGTTGMVALELGRKAVLIELNPDYVKLIHQRCDVTPGLQLA